MPALLTQRPLHIPLRWSRLLAVGANPEAFPHLVHGLVALRGVLGRRRVRRVRARMAVTDTGAAAAITFTGRFTPKESSSSLYYQACASAAGGGVLSFRGYLGSVEGPQRRHTSLLLFDLQPRLRKLLGVLVQLHVQ